MCIYFDDEALDYSDKELHFVINSVYESRISLSERYAQCPKFAKFGSAPKFNISDNR